MRIILFIVFYIVIYVTRIAIGSDIAKTISGRTMRHVFEQKSEPARSGVSKMPINDGTIQIIKRNRQSLLDNRIGGFSQSRRNYNFERVKRNLRKRKKCAKNSDCRIAHRRNNYVNDDDTDEQSISSNAMKFPIWQIPGSTVPINFDSTTCLTIMETEMNNRSLPAFEKPPSQLENLDYDRIVNETVFPIAERYPNSRRLFDLNASNKDFMLPKVANSKSENKIDVPAFEGSNNKMLLPAYRPGMLADVSSPNFSYPLGYQQQYDERPRGFSNTYNVKEKFDGRLTGFNKRFLLVPVSKNLYVLKDIQENPRTDVDGVIIPRRYKLLERDKDNATSAVLSFKAHMHHDVKDVGRAYLQRGNHRLFDHNANYLYPTLDHSYPHVPEETTKPMESPASSLPDFLYPGIAFQTRSNLIDVTPEISDEQIVSPIPDYANISFADINARSEINSYDSSVFLSSSSIDKENANDVQPSQRSISATKLDNEIDSGNYANSLGYNEFNIKVTTADFRDTLDTFDDNIYTPDTFEVYLTNDKGIFDVSQSLGNDFKFSTGKNQDEDNTFLPNITYTLVNNAGDVLNSENIDKDSLEYGISIPGANNNEKSIYSNDYDYNNRSIDETLLSNNITDVDLSLDAKYYVTAAPLLESTDERLLEKAQSNVENSHVLLMAIKPLSSELQKLLNAVKLVNRSLSDVQNRLCDKKNIVGTERGSKDRKATNIVKPSNKIDRYNSDFFTESFNWSWDKRRIKNKGKSVAERDVKFRKKTDDLFLNKLSTSFHKRESSISNSKVQSGRRAFFEKKKMYDKKFPKSDDFKKRRLPRSRFNRNLKSLTKNNEMRVNSIQQFIEAGLKRRKHTTTPVIRSLHFIKSNAWSKNNFASGYTQDHQGINQISRSTIFPNNTFSTFLNKFTKDNSAYLLSNQQDQQRNVKRAMPNEVSRSDREKNLSFTDTQFYKEATAYLDILRLLDKTKEPHGEHATDRVWTTQNLTELLPSLIFTTTEFSVSTLTLLPYFTKELTITTSSTIAEKIEALEITESSLYGYITVPDFERSEDYEERNYTRMYKDYDYEDITSNISEITLLTQSPVTLSAFTITMPTTLPLFYTTELTIPQIYKTAILTTEKMTIALPVAITTEVTEITPITISTIENFTAVSAFVLTPFLEGMTDITLKITIPVATKILIEETPVETMITEEETVKGTSITLATEVTQSLLIKTDTSLYTFSTVSLLKTIEAELTIKTTSPTVPILTTLPITEGFQITTSESTFGKIMYNTTAIASSSTVLERTETETISTSTEVTITTLTVEEESPVTQIEKTITAEETATEIPTTIETVTPTEIAITTTETSTTATEISTSIKTITITEILTINKTLTIAETPTSIEISTTSKIPTTSTVLTTIETSTVSETLTSTEILKTFKTPITKKITGTKTLTSTEVITSIETKPATKIETTTEISTSIETTIITEIVTINKTLTTTETLTSIETLTTSETPTTSTILTTIKATTITEVLTPTKILTSIETKTTAKIPTTTEISTSTETTTITEIVTINKTLTTAETSIETPTTSEIPTTSTILTTIEATTITEALTPTKILTSIETKTTAKIPITTEISTSTETTTITEIVTINKTLTTAETSIETPTTSEIPTTSTILTTIEATTITEALTPTEILTSIETKTTAKIPTTTEISTSTETTTITEIVTINKTLTTTETLTSIETLTISETPTTSTILTTMKAITITGTLTPTEILTPIETKPVTKIATTTEISTFIETTTITEIVTINKTLTTAETLTSIETLTISETPTTSTILITMKAITITGTLTPTEILTPIETKPVTKIATTTEISTSTETTTITEIVTINKTLTTAETSIETSITSEIPTTSTILTTIEATTITEALTPTEILTSIETKTTAKIPTTTEISTSTETTTITEIITINKILTTEETSTFFETLTTNEILTTSTIPTTIEATTITKTLAPTEILTTLETKKTTSTKILTPVETSIETKTIVETSTTTEISTSLFTEISTTSRIPVTNITTIETTTIMETSTFTESTTIKILTTKGTMSIKPLTLTIMKTPSTTETQMITETLTISESSETTEIPVISTTYITTKFLTTSESTTSFITTTSLKEFFPTLILTTLVTIFTTETAESISTSTTTTSVETTVPTLKLTTTTPLQILITNTTLSETPYTTISSTFLTTTERSVITTSFKTVVPTSLKSTTTTPLSLLTSTMLSETPSTTFLIEETTASLTLTTSSFGTLETTAVLPILTTVSTVETFLTTSSIATYTTGNATVSSTTASTITPESFESTISPIMYFTITPSIIKIPITTPAIMDTRTYKITSTLVTSVFLTETTEGMTSPIRKYEETKEYEEYYESTKKEIATVTSSAAELTTEEYTTWITKEVTIETTSMYLPSFTTPFFTGTTTETTLFAIKTITSSTVTEGTLLIEKVVTVTPITTEKISTLSEVTLISIETSTMSATEISSLISTTVATTTLLLEETATEITETSWIIPTLLPTTERPKYATILEAAITVTLAPFSESILSILITSETPATTPEIISVLPKTVSEEFTMSTTESPLITYATKSSTISFIETTVYPVVSISAAITKETPEAETEYYIEKEPLYEKEYEEYEEYDTEIPTGKWYYYDKYETTTKKRATVTVKYTKMPKKKTTSLPFITTTLYKTFETYSTPFEIISTYTNVTSTAATSKTSYTEEEVISLETSTIVKNVTMIEAKTEFTISAASERTESTTWLTFGSTEEYTLPSSTIFEILTEPLEYLTIPPKYTEIERFTHIWHDITSPKFITKPKKIPEIVLEKTTVSERVSAETEVTVEKLTSFFISSTFTTLSEKETFEVHTTMSTVFSETEGTIETGYKITLEMTEEETIPRITPFITSEAEIESTTTSKTIGREEEKEQLLRRLEDLKQQQREMTEREERLKEKEKQWDTEKEKRRKMMQREKEEATNITIVTGSTEGYVTTVFITSSIYTVSTKNLTVSTIEFEVTSYGLDTFITTSSLAEVITVPTETIPFSTTKEITFVAYTTEKTEEVTTEGSTSTTYAIEETEETVILYTTEKSIYITFLTEEIEKVQITDYITVTPYVTTSIMELYNIGLASIESVTPIEEIYTTSYITLYSEPLFVSPTITSPITMAIDKFITLPIATFSKRFEEVSVALVTTPIWYTTEETYTVTDMYSEPLFTSSILEFTSTTISSTLAIRTTTEAKYDKEMEKLKEKLRKKERELEERERILLEREDRLKKDIMEFENYMKEFRKKITPITPSQKSTVLTSLATPVPPTEQTTIKAQLTTQIERVTEKKENRTTTKMVTSRQTEMEEKKRTKYIPEETITQKEEEIVTKRICLNVLKNTTIPLDKRRRDIVTKKICLPYFPEKKKEVGRLNRRPLALQITKKIKRPRWNIPLNFRCRRKIKETTHKIDNLQLSHHEWLVNDTTKPLRHFKSFIRTYKKMSKFPKKIATTVNMRNNATSNFQDNTSVYKQYDFNYYDSIFHPTATSMLDNKKHGKRNDFFRYDLTFAKKNNFAIDDKVNVRKSRDVSPIENTPQFWSANITDQKATTATANEDGFYTVNVLHLRYNEDKQTHEVISAKPEEGELTVILSDSNDDNYVTEYGEDRKIATPYYEMEDEDKEDDDELADKMEKKIEEDNEDYIEDMIDNYMNYEEHETSTLTEYRKFSDDRGKDKKMTENERKLLDQAWPTEQSTTYHLGGTKFWELDFVTEPSNILCTTIDESKTIEVSITRTTCFDVVLKNEKKSEIKPNISYHKRDVYKTRKNVFIEKRNASLKNVTRKNTLRYALRTKRPKEIAKKLKRDLQKLHESNYSKRRFEERRTMRFNDFRRASNKDSITAKSRKLCGVKASKLKHRIVKHEDKNNKKKQSAKSRTLQNTNLHSLHNTSTNKKNKYYKTTTTAKHQIKKTDDKKSDDKAMHVNILDYENKSTSPLNEKKIHNCFNCICDIAKIVNNIKSLLNRMSFPLDEIKALNCSEYKETQDKIVISTDSDVEEAREFPQPHYNIESLKGQKYIKLEELEDNFNSDLEPGSDHDIVSLPGLNLNLPCNQNGDGITWLSSVSRPSYTWKRMDGIALFGFMAENGDLELRNVNAKDTGNYTCAMTYISPDNEEPVETVYEIHLQVVTLPKYVVHGEGRYYVRSCDERDLDVLVTYLPLKLNSIICEADICNAYVLTPFCSRNQITVNILLVPSRIVKLMTIDPKHCNIFCLKVIQDKLSLVLSKNLQIFLEKTIIFRLPHYEQRLVPIAEKSSFARRKRGKTDAFAGRSSNVGLFSSCPAGYGLRDTRCVPCNMGTYSEDGISHCKKCPPGTYQPNHGARVCRTCTNPMTKGCYNMLWNSFSAIMVTLASVGAMLSICLLLLWIICCAKKKFCVKRIAGIAAKEDAFETEKRVEKQPLIKDTSENEDQQWDGEYRVKRQKGKFYVNKKRRKQNERRKYDKTQTHEDAWESHRLKNTPIICPDSYQSHEDYNNYYPKRSYRKGPRLPECDFDT